MKKKLSKRVVSILLVLMMVMPNLSCMFVHAETNYPTNLENGDFEAETLSGWKFIDESSETAVTKELASDDTGKYLKFNSSANWKGIESEPFKITNVKNGDKLFVAYDWSGDSNFRVDLVSVSGVNSYSSEGNTNAKDRLTDRRTGWKSSFSQQSKVLSGVQEGTDAVFKVVIKEKDNANTTVTLIDDIAVFIIRDGAYYDLAGNRVNEKLYPYYGTTNAGMYAVKNKKNERVFDQDSIDTTGENPLSLVYGLKYWGPSYERTGYASDYASVNEGVLTVYGTTAYDGIECVRITLPEAAKGQKLAYSFQYKNSTAYAGQIKLRTWNGTTGKGDKQQNLSKNVTDWTTVEKKDIVVDTATAEISLFIQNTAQGANLQFKDIKVYYMNKEGKYVELFAPPEPEDTNVGTKDGILTETANGIYSIEATNGFINGEFSYDLKYWGTTTANTRPSAYATIKTNAEETNKYITLTGKKEQGIIARSFTLPGVISYDKIAVMFDYRGNLSDVGVKVASLDNSETVAGDGAGRTVYETTTTGGWNTAVADCVVSVKKSGTVYTLSVLLNKDDASIDIDNIRLVRVVGDNTYMALNGGTIQFSDNGSSVLSDEINVGTYTDGIITGEKNKINTLTRTEKMMNGNFEQGLMYWGTRSGESPSKYATLKKESNGNTYVTFSGENYQDIAMRRFVVSGLKAGEQVALMGNYRSSSKNLVFVLEAVNSQSTSSGSSMTELYVDKDSSKWSTAASKTLTLGEISTENQTKYGTSEYVFQMRVESSSKTGSPITVDLDNFKIVKVKADGTYTELDGTKIEFKNSDGSTYNPLVGTYADGIVTGIKNGIQQLKASDKIYNGDFEQGLMYWGTRSGESPNKYATIKKENGNTYVTFKGENYQDIFMRRFIVSGLKAGDKVALMGNYRGSSKNLVFVLEAVNTQSTSSGSSMTELYVDKDSNKWSTAASKTLTLGAISDADKTKYGTSEYVFQMRVESSSKTGNPISVDVDNLKIVKVKADGTYTELDGTKIEFKNPDGSIYNPLTGTYADGIITGMKNGIQQMIPSDKMYNGDFEQGLMYWGTRSGESPNKYATIKKENGNTYVTFKGENYQDIFMRRFIVSGLKAGEQIALMGNYRGNADGLVFVFECVNAEGSGNSRIELFRGAKSSEWSTGVSKTGKLGVISEENKTKYGTGEYIFQIRVESSSKAGKPITVDVDNLRLVKVKADGSYTELDGTPIVFKNADGSVYNPSAGTYEEGIVTGTKYGINLLAPTEKFQNGDFEEGFKWWATVEGCSPKDYATIKKENGNTYITMHSSEWKGIVQSKFYFDGLKKGDTLAVMVNYRGDTQFQMVLNAWNVVDVEKNRALGSTILYEPTQEGEWGIAVTRTNFVMSEIDKTLIEKYGERLMFRLMLQPTGGEITTDFDNVRIVRVNADGSYSELDGTPIVIPTNEGTESATDGLLDWNWGEDETSENNTTDGKKQKMIESVKDVIVISCIVVGVAVVIAAGVLVFLTLKKRKQTVVATENKEE